MGHAVRSLKLGKHMLCPHLIKETVARGRTRLL